MKKISFKLQIWCMVGWDDNEDTATLEVDSFEQVLEVSSVLKEFQRTRGLNQREEVLQAYKEIKEELESDSGEDIMMLGEVSGIQCSYEDNKGIKVSVTLSDNSGISGWAKVNNEEYENEYKRLLGDAKKLATQIMRL